MFFHELRQDALIADSEPLQEQIENILAALAPNAEENETFLAPSLVDLGLEELLTENALRKRSVR